MAIVAKKLHLAEWVQATRPRVFTAALVPMGIAGAVAAEDGVFRVVPFVLSLLGVMLLQTTANLVNEYADYKRGADEFKEAGQGMAIQQTSLTPRDIFLGAVFSVVAGSLIGLYLLSQSGSLLWWIGIVGVLIAITYTAGPYPLAYHGLGEIAAGIGMGPMIVVGAYYVMDTDVSWDLVWISFPVMFLLAAILHANNIRDLEADKAVNKRTLAVMFGRDVARKELMFLIGGAYIAHLILVIVGLMPRTTVISFITIPIALKLIRIFNTSTEVSLMHKAQGGTAKLLGQYGLLTILGWLVWVWFLS
jgi:1,4-dihydroxy-2-naphthoate octaprenyltransferase